MATWATRHVHAISGANVGTDRRSSGDRDQLRWMIVGSSFTHDSSKYEMVTWVTSAAQRGIQERKVGFRIIRGKWSCSYRCPSGCMGGAEASHGGGATSEVESRGSISGLNDDGIQQG